jgi:hypothetical protein
MACGKVHKNKQKEKKIKAIWEQLIIHNNNDKTHNYMRDSVDHVEDGNYSII